MGPIREPSDKVMVRYEPDTKLLFISNHEWRQDCGKMFMGYDDTLNPYRKNNALLGMKRKRMLAGTVAANTGAISALTFDTTKLEFFSEGLFLNEDSESEGRDSVETT